jgi:UDP-N-acetylmuramoyl-tripeptide--D-alanyl-D-alanine ligase
MNRRTAELWVRQVALGPLIRRCAPLLFGLAAVWRRLMFRTTFIAVTGSAGKTTTKEFLADILASKGRTFRTVGNQNGGFVVPLNILRVRPWHQFAVFEVAVNKPGSMRPLAAVVRPHVALILNVLRAHTTEFENLDQYAAEKAILLESLAVGGLAVLNGDDSRVAKMAENVDGRVCLTGVLDKFDFWIDRISSAWPDRLQFHIHHAEECCDVQTKQVGTHWAPDLMAALATAHSLGFSLSEAAEVLRQTPPYTGRLEPVSLPNGAILLRDDYSSSIDTLDASFQVLREAKASRRMLIITDFADAGLHRRPRLKYLAVAVSGWLDVLILCGAQHDYGRRRAIEAGVPPENVHSFATLIETADFLKKELRAGDLALLRGLTTDHVTRLYFAQIGTLTCWRESCPKTMLCDTCWELGFQPEAANGAHSPALPIAR